MTVVFFALAIFHLKSFGAMWTDDTVPGGFIMYSTLERICSNRLRAYSSLDALSSSKPELSEVWHSSALDALKLNFPEIYYFYACIGSPFQYSKGRRYEKISACVASHIIVQKESLALKKWFIQNEMRLFRLRFAHLKDHEKVEFLLKNRIAKKIDDNLYEVSWKLILPLVKKRLVNLKDGKASISSKHFIIAASAFMVKNITLALKTAKTTLSSLKLDSRINNLLERLSGMCHEYVDNLNRGPWKMEKDDVDLKTLDERSLSFPPCMERMYRHMEANHRLRYNARQQLIPFLKDIGLTLPDMLNYFQSHSTYVMTPEEYKKGKYAYYINYMYGFNGRKKEYFSFDCNQMKLNSTESILDCHGCPVLSSSNLCSLLSSESNELIPSAEKEDIKSSIGKLPAGQICGKILSSKLSVSEDIIIASPIQYYAIHRNRITAKYDSD